ncbi:hypothetical protein PV04_01948 [Phialophora macrospora]|uniref:Transcription factor domain-containing protein n=1 Tax=Phialophora macrospora TaxID=1851006 RepID=A0A0D2FZB2_9EURO|nr:hypothetical protein PV04_01948 [Phialophora macrospora]
MAHRTNARRQNSRGLSSASHTRHPYRAGTLQQETGEGSLQQLSSQFASRVGRVDPPSSTKTPSSSRQADSEPQSKEILNRNGTISHSTSQVLGTDLAAARDSAQTLLRVSPANSYGLPLDAAMMEEKFNPMVAIQFFIEVYSPSMLRHPSFRLESRDSIFLETNLPVMMQDPLITTSSLAFAMRMHDRGLSRKVLGYYRKALVLLRTRLESGEVNSTNAILLSLIHLMAVEALCEQLGSPIHHLGAIHRLIRFCGDLASTAGLQGYIKAHIRSWEVYLVEANSESDKRQVQLRPHEPLDYPTHPFGSELTLLLSRLPDGFVELALSCRLSFQVIRVLQYTAEMMSDLDQQNAQRHDYENDATELQSQLKSPAQALYVCMSILRHPNRNMVEELLAITLMALCISTEALGEHITNGFGYIQTYCMGIWNVDIERECRRTGGLGLEDFLLWAKMMLLAAFDPDTQTWKTACGLRKDVPIFNIRPLHFDICKQFFWTDSLALSLETKIAREQLLMPARPDKRQ